jgi:predicted transporter
MSDGRSFPLIEFCASPIATECVQPPISLMTSGSSLVVEPAVCALNRLLDEEYNAEIAATSEVIDLLVSFILLFLG